jgi:hypothetical protein
MLDRLPSGLAFPQYLLLLPWSPKHIASRLEMVRPSLPRRYYLLSLLRLPIRCGLQRQVRFKIISGWSTRHNFHQKLSSRPRYYLLLLLRLQLPCQHLQQVKFKIVRWSSPLHQKLSSRPRYYLLLLLRLQLPCQHLQQVKSKIVRWSSPLHQKLSSRPHYHLLLLLRLQLPCQHLQQVNHHLRQHHHRAPRLPLCWPHLS